MLVDKDDPDIFSLLRKFVECSRYCSFFGLVVHHEEIALRVRRFGDMPDPGEEQTGDRTDNCE